MRSLLLSFCALAVNGQDSLQILLEENTVLVGRTMALRVVVRDAEGNPRPESTGPNGNVVWNANPATVATISASGELRPLTLGMVRVTARVGSLTAEVPIQTVPREVRILPASATLAVGATQPFRAEALNADGVVIPGVTFAWQANNRNGERTSLITVSSAGLLTARSDGGAIVRATYTYSDSPPGFQREWILTAPVDVVTPQGYLISKLINSRENLPSSFEIRSRPSMLWGTATGELFFNANLDGTANGLINWRDGVWKLVSAGGQPRFVSGSLATDFRTHSITPDGRILSWEDTRGNGSQLNRGDKNGLRPFLTQDAPIAGTEGTDGIQITRNSTSSSGWVIVRAAFRFPGHCT